MATIIGYGSKHSHEFKLTVNEISTNVENNTSEVSFDFTIYKASYSWNGWNSITYTITINGTPYTGTIPSYSAGSTMTIKSGSQSIKHEDNGSKTISCSFSVNDATGQSYTCGNASASGNLTLTTIPRASSISCTTANIEETATIIINRASSSFTHTVKYEFGSLSGTIAEKTSNTSIGWTLPTSFYTQIPNDKMGAGTLRCTTYNGDTEVGSSAILFYVNTSEEKCKPSLSATVIDTNSETIALTGSNTKLIKHKSTAKITITTSAKNSASISNKKVNNTTVSGDSISITEIETDTFIVTVTDSRGYSNSVTLKPTVINYIPLTINTAIKRTRPTTGEVDIAFSGNYFNGNFGSTSNTLTLNWYYRKSGESTWTTGGALSKTISNNTYSNGETAISLGTIFDYQSSYEFYLEVADKLTTLKPTYTVTQGIPIFNWGKDFVNFMKKVLLNGIDILNKIDGVILFEDENGITEGTITLNDSKNNYRKIEIYDPSGKLLATHLTGMADGTISLSVTDQGAETLYVFASRLTMTENQLTFYSNKRNYFDGTTWVQDTVKVNAISKIIGYK